MRVLPNPAGMFNQQQLQYSVSNTLSFKLIVQLKNSAACSGNQTCGG